MEFKTKTWIKKEKVINTFKSDVIKAKLTLVKSSILSILFGLAIGIIIIFITGYNGFSFIGVSIIKGLDSLFIDKTMNYFSTYALMGLGLAIGFKIGIFNMGGTGQATIGFTFSIIAIGNKAAKDGVDFRSVNPSFVVAVFMIFILSGLLFSTISGLLKVFFNIHEVVTTVMLNFILWYTTLWFFNTHDGAWGPSNNSTVPVNSSWLNIGNNPWLLGFILVLISVGILYFIFTFTTFGYKFKVVGKQSTAADYAGINKNLFIVIATALQGLFIGMGGFIYYMTIMPSIHLGTEVLPTIGFDAIPIALVAFNNFIGIIPVAFIWAVLNNGTLIATGTDFIGMSNEIPVLIFGAITYGAGIYILFTKFVPIKWLKYQCFIYKDIIIQNEIKNKKSKINEQKKLLKEISNDKDIIELRSKIELKDQEIKNLKLNGEELENKLSKLEKLKQELVFLNKTLSDEVDNKKSIIQAKISMLKDEFKMIFDKRYSKYKRYSIKGLKKQQKEFNQINRYALLDEFVADSLYLDEIQRQHKLELKQLKLNLKEKEQYDKVLILELKNKNKQIYKEEQNKIDQANKIKLYKIVELNKQEKIKLKENIEKIKSKLLENKNQFNLEMAKIKESDSNNIENINTLKVKYTNLNMEVIKNYG